MKKYFVSFIVIIIALNAGCKKKDEVSTDQTSQFASKVIGFSSEYTSSPGWTAKEALGSPDIYPEYGDVTNTWASSSADANREYLILGFGTEQTVNKIEVYETYKPGAIDTVYLRDAASKKWHKVWHGTAKKAPNAARIFTVEIPETSYKVNAVRIALNSPVVLGYNEIDAIGITGSK